MDTMTIHELANSITDQARQLSGILSHINSNVRCEPTKAGETPPHSGVQDLNSVLLEAKDELSAALSLAHSLDSKIGGQDVKDCVPEAMPMRRAR